MFYLFAVYIAVGVALVDYINYLYPYNVIF